MSIQLKVPFEGIPETPIDVTVYAFDRQGGLIASAPLKDGLADLPLPPERARGARIFLAPTPREGMSIEPTPRAMEQLKAYEAVWSFDPQRASYELAPIPTASWRLWRWCACRVRGKVVRPTTISGATQSLPVCHARVHVAEIDELHLIIPRLPDDVLRRIADELIHELERVGPRPGPGPDPGPEFLFDPGVIDPTPELVARIGQPERLREVLVSPRLRPPLTRPMPPLARPPEAPLAPRAVPLELRAALTSPSLVTVRDSLLRNVELVRPYLCLWPWIWPHFYASSELAVSVTDLQGRFDTTVYYLCGGDQPDLYFWVEYSVGGAWSPVYKPPIPCHTYWNYASGSEVLIRVSDPRVVGCAEPPSLPGRQVAVLTIGNNISVHEIQSSGPGEGLTSDGRPLGASLEPHVWFGQDLIAAGISHYRWSYRRAGGGDAWHAMDRVVVRHYAVIGPGGMLTFKPHVLGPDPAIPGAVLFQIQGPAPGGSSGWTPMVDARENTASAFFLSHLLAGGDAAAAAGRYELKLELFRPSAPLTPVNLTDEGIALKVPTVPAPFGIDEVPTAPADDAHVIRDGTGKIVAFRLVLFVDNQPCVAGTSEVTGAGLSAVGECGFLRYAPSATAHIAFRAGHPNNFGNFVFTTVRGSAAVPGACAAANLGTSPAGAFAYNPSSRTYAADLPVAALLSPACPSAALAEQVEVYAWATDGWSTLWYLNAYSGMRAYALTPQP